MKIIFSGNKLPLSLAIRIITFSKWHHCGIVDSENNLYESFPPHGVIKSNILDFKKRGSWAEIDLPVTHEQELKIIEFLEDQLGKSYDYWGIAALVFQSRDWHEPNSWYCSELIVAALEYAGIFIFRRDLSGISPNDLWIVDYTNLNLRE